MVGKIWVNLKLFWELFQKPILIAVFLVLCYKNTDHFIILFKNTADWIAKQAGVAVTDHVIVVESRKPVKKDLLKGNKPKANEGFMWPVTGPVSSPFGNRWGGEMHHGIDIAVSQGTQVANAKDGYVEKAGWSNVYGNYVQVDHGSGVSTLYGHNSLIYASKGQMVKQGEILAISGSTGRSTGPHVHFEIRFNNKAINPLTVNFDGLERQEFAQKLAKAEKNQTANIDSPDEIKRRYLVTMEKTKQLKIAELTENINIVLKSWDATIGFQYRASYGMQADTVKYVALMTEINRAFIDAAINFSELLPILAAQIQINNDPDHMVVKATKPTLKT